MSFPTRILVRGPNYLGDHVMALPFYQSLREGFPKSHLTLLTTSHLTDLKPKGFDSVLQLGSVFRGQFELGITLPASLSSAWMLFKARIPRRVGFSEPLGLPFLTRGKRWRGVKGGQHKRDLYLEILGLLDLVASQTPPGFEGVDPTSEEREDIIVIAPGASISLREWPYFPELVNALSSELPRARLVVVGGQREIKWREKFKNSHVTDLIQKTSLPELAQVLARAKLVIANDSGVAHLAATVAKTPTLVLLGPGNPNYIVPSGRRVKPLRIDIPCSPCESAKCRAKIYKRCLNDLAMGHVLQEAVLLFQE